MLLAHYNSALGRSQELRQLSILEGAYSRRTKLKLYCWWMLVISLTHSTDWLPCRILESFVHPWHIQRTCILINSYRDSTELFVNGDVLLSREGTTQGDPLAMSMYAIATVPLIRSLDRSVTRFGM